MSNILPGNGPVEMLRTFEKMRLPQLQAAQECLALLIQARSKGILPTPDHKKYAKEWSCLPPGGPLLRQYPRGIITRLRDLIDKQVIEWKVQGSLHFRLKQYPEWEITGCISHKHALAYPTYLPKMITLLEQGDALQRGETLPTYNPFLKKKKAPWGQHGVWRSGSIPKKFLKYYPPTLTDNINFLLAQEKVEWIILNDIMTLRSIDHLKVKVHPCFTIEQVKTHPDYVKQMEKFTEEMVKVLEEE